MIEFVCPNCGKLSPDEVNYNELQKTVVEYSKIRVYEDSVIVESSYYNDFDTEVDDTWFECSKCGNQIAVHGFENTVDWD